MDGPRDGDDCRAIEATVVQATAAWAEAMPWNLFAVGCLAVGHGTQNWGEIIPGA